MTIEERIILSKQPITWTGDLADDCKATWAGLLLRAEWMDEDYWWWSVYDMQKNEVAIDNSNNHTERFIGGEVSRQMAESVAQQYIVQITNRQEVAKYFISDTFKITGRGLVFVGYILEGCVTLGNNIEFEVFSSLYQRKIIGIEGITYSSPNKVNTGLLLKCIHEEEIDELRNWKPENVIACIYT